MVMPSQGLPSEAEEQQMQEPNLSLPKISHVSGAASELQGITKQEQQDTQYISAIQRQMAEPREHIDKQPLLAVENRPSSPAYIKQEPVGSSGNSPLERIRPAVERLDMDSHNQKQVAALKTEGSMRNSSPLRESSTPMPTSEFPEQVMSKKRPAPAKVKKGTATTTKKAPTTKKPKLQHVRSATPSSRVSKSTSIKNASAKNTPVNSSPVPSTRSQSVDVDEEQSEGDDDEDEGDYDGDGDVYCICRKPDTGTFMIGCDGTCDDWFHGKCVGIEERDKTLIDKYICPNCTEAGIGRTTWKRMCRRPTCRQAARIGGSKNNKENSKYCSDECGVLFFREMMARSRGKEEMARQRITRRKTSIIEQTSHLPDEDLGPRGGVLSTGEVKRLVESSKNAEQFRRLGEGVLSPPTTPDENKQTTETTRLDHLRLDAYFTEAEQQTLARILNDKDAARQKHALLKDRMKFVTMAKQAAVRIATEKELKAKDYCGYDSRIQWSEDQFATWRTSKTGKRALELGTFEVDAYTDVEMADKDNNDSNHNNNDDDENDDDDDDLDEHEICDRKKCARHLEWPKLAMDDVRFEIGDNSDHMRALDREEREMRERVALRAKRMADAGRWRAEGSVETHHTAAIKPSVVQALDQSGEIDGEDSKMAVDAAGTTGVLAAE